MIKVYIGLGSNLDDPQSQLKKAIIAMEMVPSTSVAKTSSFYRSKPVGPQDQPNYVNAVVELDTELSASVLLDYLQAIENDQGRERKVKWGARTLDLDILLFGDEIINDDRLQIPHVEMQNRGFVLLPLNEIFSDCIIPGVGSVSSLLQQDNADDLIKLT
ncbi:MAG: 2-amino-4-hydroxy-6-hydroxymethyldihydropteridine diphosphokinase [Gammaproteobacteria bacterium]|nr:MAG: 2-amino-4-hydroxy-6-hydroxymethyldihydropteridine diphosphokinase [Gammaproteobacteria bacterium]